MMWYKVTLKSKSAVCAQTALVSANDQIMNDDAMAMAGAKYTVNKAAMLQRLMDKWLVHLSIGWERVVKLE